MHHRSRAHRARFNCSKQLAASQAVVPQNASRSAQGHHFGMCGRVMIGEVPVPSSADQLPIQHDNRSHGYFAHFECALGQTRASAIQSSSEVAAAAAAPGWSTESGFGMSFYAGIAGSPDSSRRVEAAGSECCCLDQTHNGPHRLHPGRVEEHRNQADRDPVG